MSWTPPPASIGLTYAYGRASLVVTLGEYLLGESLTYNHAFLVLDGQRAMEPWPTGARMVDLSRFERMPVAYVCPALDESERRRVVVAARSLDGTTYRIRDFQVITAWRVGWRGERLRRSLHSRCHLPPAPFVAEAYRRAGVDLLAPGTAAGATIGDLSTLLLTSGRASYGGSAM